ncbi:serine/threonine protein kinase [Rhodococcus opacus]|nr:serine/threonine protein kinase [Rhodococcus opacus]
MQGGALFGRYRLDRPLSVDGTGEVWAAVDTLTSRHVAVRALPPEATEDDGYRERFERGADIAAHLRNPHVLPIHDFGQIGNRLFLATPITPGTTLRTMLRSTGAMEVPRAVGVVEQLASALEAVRAAGLVEPEVASSNVLVQDGGLIQLTDVGLPTPPGAASGVYGLTAVLYECLTGTLFPSLSGTELPPRPSSVIATVPVGLDAVIARGMAVEPARRFRSAGELAAAARGAATPPEPAAARGAATPPEPAAARGAATPPEPAAARGAATPPRLAAGLTPALVPVDWGRRVLVAGLVLAAILAVVGGVILGSGSYAPDVAGPAPVSSAARGLASAGDGADRGDEPDGRGDEPDGRGAGAIGAGATAGGNAARGCSSTAGSGPTHTDSTIRAAIATATGTSSGRAAGAALRSGVRAHPAAGRAVLGSRDPAGSDRRRWVPVTCPMASESSATRVTRVGACFTSKEIRRALLMHAGRCCCHPGRVARAGRTPEGQFTGNASGGHPGSISVVDADPGHTCPPATTTAAGTPPSTTRQEHRHAAADRRRPRQRRGCSRPEPAVPPVLLATPRPAASPHPRHRCSPSPCWEVGNSGVRAPASPGAPVAAAVPETVARFAGTRIRVVVALLVEPAATATLAAATATLAAASET